MVGGVEDQRLVADALVGQLIADAPERAVERVAAAQIVRVVLAPVALGPCEVAGTSSPPLCEPFGPS